MDESQYELYHYGVPGMKWGIRRGKANVAYAKGLRKLKKYEDKIAKADRRAEKHQKRLAKYVRFGSRFIEVLPHTAAFNSVNSYNAKKYSAQIHRAKRLRKKKEKFQKKMDKTFKGINVNKLDFSELQQKRKYAEALLARKRKQI